MVGAGRRRRGAHHPRRLAAPRAHANTRHSRPGAHPPLRLPLPRKVVLQGDGLNRGRRGAHLAYVVTDEHSEG